MLKQLLFITNKYPPLSCGVGDYTLNLVNEFFCQGFSVSVVCRSDDKIKRYWQDHTHNQTVHTIGGNWKKRDWNKVLKLIDVSAPDAVLFQYVPGSYDHYAVPWALIYFYNQLSKRQLQVITTFHETYVRFTWSHPKYLYTALGQRIITKLIAKNSDKLITSIERYQNQLKKWNNQVSVIPVGTNIIPVKVSDQEVSALRAEIAPNGESVLSTFGNRNHKYLLEWFDELLKLKPDCVLLIIGKLNVDLGSLSNRTKGRTYVTGFLKSEDVYRHLKVSDIFFHVTSFSRQGGANNKSGALAAAFAAGLPIIGSHGDMTNRLLLEKSQLVWISFDHKLEMMRSILSLLEKKGKLKLLSEASIEFFNRFLTWSKIQKQYQVLLERDDNT